MTFCVEHDADHLDDCYHRHQDVGLRCQEHQHQRQRLQDVGHQHQQNQDDQGHLLHRDEHQDHQDGHQDHRDERQEPDVRQDHQDVRQDHQVVGQALGDLLEERDVKNQEVAE